MSNSRFITTNLVNQSGVTVLNGGAAIGGVTPPATEQATGYPMSNAINASRYTLWTTTATPTAPLYLDIDMGTTTAATCAWISGLRYADPTKPLGTVVVRSATTYGTWTTRGTITDPNFSSIPATYRDIGVVFSQAYGARYWRFQFSFSAGVSKFSLGKVGLGRYDDLGMNYAPGSEDTPLRYQTVTRTVAGHPEIQDFGDPGRRIRLLYPAIDFTTRDVLLALAGVSGSFMYVDPADSWYEVRLTNGEVAHQRLFDPASLASVTVDLERLP